MNYLITLSISFLSLSYILILFLTDFSMHKIQQFSIQNNKTNDGDYARECCDRCCNYGERHCETCRQHSQSPGGRTHARPRRAADATGATRARGCHAIRSYTRVRARARGGARAGASNVVIVVVVEAPWELAAR